MSAPESEAGMRKAVTTGLRARGWHAIAEDCESSSPGHPDVGYCGRLEEWIRQGHLELKHVAKEPRRDGTAVRVKRYTLAQKEWHRDRKNAGGTVRILLVVGDRWYLLDTDWCERNLGTSSVFDIHAAARASWSGGFQADNIIPWL